MASCCWATRSFSDASLCWTSGDRGLLRLLGRAQEEVGEVAGEGAEDADADDDDDRAERRVRGW